MKRTRRHADASKKVMSMAQDLKNDGTRTNHRVFDFHVIFSPCLRAPVVTAFVVALLFPSSSWAGTPAAPVPIEELRSQVASLQQEVAQLEQENHGLRRFLAAQDDGQMYIVVDTERNRLSLRQGNTVLHTAVCGTGSRQFIEAETGNNWYFETPMGSFTVLGKERNPVWIRPDWSYVEENMPVPAENDPDRLVRGVLGKYALLLGNGYKIHGTKWTNLLGTHFTHGCISLGDNDLEVVYKSAQIGTKVYLY
jgi:L,D-transpeptidase ErfK/SrfK